VCLDVINQTWSPMYELQNIFDIFLPQLLLYPNPTDPLNAEAASLQLKNEEKYKEKVQAYLHLSRLGTTLSATRQLILSKRALTRARRKMAKETRLPTRVN